MSDDPLLVRGLLRCYPSRWRRRYGDEYAALLADTLAGASRARRSVLVVNVLRGAFDARLIRLGGALMSARSPLTTAIWATGLFTIAGVAFQKLTEDPAITATADTHHGIDWSFTALLVAAAIAVAALVVTTLPAAAHMIRGHANGTWLLVAVPPVAFAAWYGILRLGLLVTGHHSVHSARNVLAAVLVVVAGVGVVAATAWAANAVLRRVDVTGPPRLRRASMSVVSAGMTAATIACLVWGLTVRSANPSGFGPHNGVLASPFILSWIIVLVLMATATTLTAAATRRQT
jgi:hypothetical protein